MIKEVEEFAFDLRSNNNDLTVHQSLELAVQIQHTRILRDAYVVFPNTPSAFEKIAMSMDEKYQTI